MKPFLQLTGPPNFAVGQSSLSVLVPGKAVARTITFQALEGLSSELRASTTVAETVE